MPTASESATALVRRIARYTVAFVISVALLACGIVLWRQKSLELAYLDAKPILVELTRTEDERRKGLSSRARLAAGHGMLFVFDEPSPACMWMKDMNFDIDAYWYSATGSLISTAENIQSKSFPKIYCPELPASYMLEVNIGEFDSPPQKLVLQKPI